MGAAPAHRVRLGLESQPPESRLHRTSHVLTHAENAERAGASGLLLAPMTYQPLTDDDVFELFRTVTAHSSLPVVVYDNPGTTHFTFSTELYGRIAELPGIASIKIPGVPADPQQARARLVALGSAFHAGRTSGPGALARYVFAATLVRSADGGAVVAIVLLAHACGIPGWLSALLRASITARHSLGPFIARRLATARDGRKVIAFSAVLHGCSSGPQRRSCRSQHSQQLLRPPASFDRWGFTSPKHGAAPSFGKEKTAGTGL